MEDTLFILGDFNARVGTGHQTWECVVGSNGIGKCSSNRFVLLRTFISHDLHIINTLFRQADCNKATWMHPRSKHWHLIDCVITRKADRKDVNITRAIKEGGHGNSHVNSVVSSLNFNSAKSALRMTVQCS